jgi:hypothetical protein
MYYHVGVVNQDLQTITWGPAYLYDIGWDPSVAAYGSTIVEVHNNATAKPGSIWYHVGQLDSNLTVGWGPPHSYDNGWEPKVAIVASNGNDDLAQLGSAPLVFEVHNGQGNFGPMWYHLGQSMTISISVGDSRCSTTKGGIRRSLGCGYTRVHSTLEPSKSIMVRILWAGCGLTATCGYRLVGFR